MVLSVESPMLSRPRPDYGEAMPISWPEEIDDVLGGDLTAALAVATPAGGAVVTAVTPIGLRDRERGTVTFLTSLGFSRKLDHIRADPRVALAYHARTHGTSTSRRFVLVQGTARVELHSTQAEIDRILDRAQRVLGGPPRFAHRFWGWWMREYATVRVPVIIDVDTITSWPDLDCVGTPETWTTATPSTPGLPASRHAPAGGTAPRIPMSTAARRVGLTSHRLLGFLDKAGCPTIAPVTVTSTSGRGFAVTAAPGIFPLGTRRAGLLAHEYRARLVGIRTHFFTGWLTATGSRDAIYAPHTEAGFSLPANKTLLLLANGLMAKVGVRRASRAGAIAEWPTPFRHSAWK
jgi:hypothetical protein